MLDPSTQQLIRKLVELTEVKRLAWKEGEGQRCLLESEGYVVEISGDPPGLRLLQDGRVIDCVESAELSTVEYAPGEGTFAARVSSMARQAGRVARGAETAISKILSSLSAPPMKPADPEPEPAAIAFEPAPASAIDVPPRIESAAAIAAVTADLASVRQFAAEHAPTPPPAPHAAPEPPPVEPVPPAVDTSLSRIVLLTESASPAPAPPAPGAESGPRDIPAGAPPRSMAEGAPRPAFGAVESFARATPTQPAIDRGLHAVAHSTPGSTALFMSGFSARSVQKPEAATAVDLARLAPAQPQPSPPPAPRTEPRETATTGADIYKPWR